MNSYSSCQYSLWTMTRVILPVFMSDLSPSHPNRVQWGHRTAQCHERVFHSPRRKSIQHCICPFLEWLVLNNTLWSILRIVRWLSISTLTPLLRLRRRLHPTPDLKLRWNVCCAPSQHSRHPISGRRRPLPSLLHRHP